MRSTRTSVCLVAIGATCAALLFGTSSSVWSLETKKASPRIKELQMKRLAALEQVYEIASQIYKNGRASYEDVHSAEVALLAARLEAAETQEERVKVCDEAVAGAVKWHAFAQELVKSAQASRITELKAEAYVLETQIMREKITAE